MKEVSMDPGTSAVRFTLMDAIRITKCVGDFFFFSGYFCTFPRVRFDIKNVTVIRFVRHTFWGEQSCPVSLQHQADKRGRCNPSTIKINNLVYTYARCVPLEELAHIVINCPVTSGCVCLRKFIAQRYNAPRWKCSFSETKLLNESLTWKGGSTERKQERQHTFSAHSAPNAQFHETFSAECAKNVVADDCRVFEGGTECEQCCPRSED